MSFSTTAPLFVFSEPDKITDFSTTTPFTFDESDNITYESAKKLHPKWKLLTSRTFSRPGAYYPTEDDGTVVTSYDGAELRFRFRSGQGSRAWPDCEFMEGIMFRNTVQFHSFHFVRIDFVVGQSPTRTVYNTAGSDKVWIKDPLCEEKISKIVVYWFIEAEGPVSAINLKLYQDCLDASLECDATLRVEGVELRAHRLILASQSQVFAKMFEGSFKEASNGNVEIKDFSCKAVEKLLEFFYTGQIKKWEGTESDLIKLGDMFLVDGMNSLLSVHMLRMQGEYALKLLIQLQGSPLLTKNDIEKHLLINVSNYFCSSWSSDNILRVIMEYISLPAITIELRRILLSHLTKIHLNSLKKVLTSPAWIDFETYHPLLSDAIIAIATAKK